MDKAEQKAKRETQMQSLNMYQSNGWEVVEETPEYFLLKRNTQSIGIHFVILIFFWWTLGLANLIYWLLCKQTKKLFK